MPKARSRSNGQILPHEISRTWIRRRNWGVVVVVVETKGEFEDSVVAADGDDIGTPCMSKNPEAYYGTRGE